MRANKVYLAVDLGAESGRLVAGLFDGQSLRLEEVHRFPNGPVDLCGNLHWDILRLFSEIKSGIGIASSEYAGALTSLGVDSWGVDYGLLDGQDKLMGNPYHYRDRRTDGMLAEAFRRVSKEEIYRVTGIQFLYLNTLYQLLSEVCDDTPQLAAAQRLLFIPDLINFWLTGEKVNERTIASTSQLLDPRSGSWANSLIQSLRIPRGIFGEIMLAGTPISSLLPAVRTETGAGELKVVAPACHDTASAVVAVPTRVQRYAYLSSGTWCLMGTESASPIITDKSREYGFSNEGGVFGTFRFLKNINGLWLVEECRRSWSAEGRDTDYGRLFEAARSAEPFFLFVDPDDPGLQKPGEVPVKLAEICRCTGQSQPTDPGNFIRMILESLAFKYRFVLERMEEAVGYTLEPLHIIGGGARNGLLNQFAANATNRVVVTGPVEATSTGNIVMQMIAQGDLSSIEEGRELVLHSFETRSYEPEQADRWSSAYERFKRLLMLGEES